MRGRAASPGEKNTSSVWDATSGEKESTVASCTFILLTLAATGMGWLLALLPAAGHDQMWCLYAAELVRHGTKLYGPELFESNPPLIIWLSRIPSALSAWTHLPPTAVAKLLALLLGAAVARVCLRLLPEQMASTRAARWWLAFVYVTAFAVLPARDFGQRDQLLPFFCLPYLLGAARAASERPLRGWRGWAAGVAAGTGLALKPHHAVMVLAVEALVARRRRSLRALVRPEVLGIAATGAVYLAAIRGITPEYPMQVLPVLRDTYWAIGHLSVMQSLREAIQLHVLAAVAIALHLVRGGSKELGRVSGVLLTAGAASTVAYYLQGTGWYYQQLPALTFFVFALGVDAPGWMDCRVWKVGRIIPVLAGSLGLLALWLTAYFSGYRVSRPLEFPSGLPDVPNPAFFAGLAPGTPVAILTTEVDASIPPVVSRHLMWAQRQNNLWTLPAILRNETPMSAGDPAHKVPAERLAELDRMQHAWMVEDLTRWRPRLILVERCQDPRVQCQILEDRHDDLLAWFLRDPRFRAIFQQYRYVRSDEKFDAYVPR